MYGKTFFTSLLVLLMGICFVFIPVCRDQFWQHHDRVNPSTSSSFHLKHRFMTPLLLILMGFFFSYGMQDYAASCFWMGGEDILVYTRIFLILGFMVGGILCDLRGKHMILNSSFSLLAMGFVSMALQYKGLFSFIGFSCVQLGSAVFSIGVLLLFLDIARYYKRQVFICSLGLAFPMVLKQMGIISASILYKTLSNMSIFLVSLLAIIAVLPLVSVLFEKIRTAGMESIRQQSSMIDLAGALDSALDTTELEKSILFPCVHTVSCHTSEYLDEPGESVQMASGLLEMTQNFAGKHALTNRETQVLELTLHGLSISEMAQTLNLAESTIKQYIRQMLRKTEVKNRRELLSMLIKESQADA